MSDKSNVMTYAGGLWQRVFKLVAAEYPDIQSSHMYVDALCMHMVRDPRQFDVRNIERSIRRGIARVVAAIRARPVQPHRVHLLLRQF